MKHSDALKADLDRRGIFLEHQDPEAVNAYNAALEEERIYEMENDPRDPAPRSQEQRDDALDFGESLEAGH